MNFSELVTPNGLFCDGDWIEKKDQNTNGNVRLIQLADIGVCFFKNKSSKFVTERKAQELNCTYLQKGDILIARLPEPLGRACIFPLDGKYITAVDIAIVRIDRHDVNPKYVMYMLNSPGFRSEIRQYESGTTRKRISRKNLDKIQFDVPALSEQNRVVAHIEELFSQLDASVNELKTAKERLKVYRQAVLKKAFNGELTAAKKTGAGTIGNYIEKPRYGTSKKCNYSYSEKSKEVYRIPNVDYTVGQISHQDIKYSEFSENEIADLKLECGDILIIRSNGSVSLVGRAALIREADINGTFAGYLMRLRIKDKSLLLPEFLLYFLQSHGARVYIENKAKSTSGVHNINSAEISGLRFPIFEIEDQRDIVSVIESRLSVCDSIKQTVDTTLRQAEALRQSILKEAFHEKR